MLRQLSASIIEYPLKKPFKITHSTRTTTVVIYVEIIESDIIGKAVSVPYKRYGETPESVLSQIHQMKSEIESGLSIEKLQTVLSPGAARNALDCALLDINSQKKNMTLEALIGVPSLPRNHAFEMAYTIGVDSPDKMAIESESIQETLIKLKCCGDGYDIERLKKVRGACPKKQLLVDVNEGWNESNIQTMISVCESLNIFAIEQPMPANNDALLAEIESKIMIIADESCHTSRDLDYLIGKYDMVNIKLDKTGGLTEAVLVYKTAIRLGLGIMLGCMVGPELAIRPARSLTHLAEIIDLDGPMFLATT